ncbi:MAG: hypothetical protein A3F82_01075 [Deltaproteobacteria bacterium RIFCSPLOWO2_12_FULL_44_12]|nr:MAG: hypothetical protein A2712_03880 [Deltaproteobacteria bacterium RIFCSPHIGHO2_01_FULL_43_49]OGQ16326.1 MAG: hypothetical protein A3D22_01850 [Deltaproteobacteria bacterium RIFCSPHIGHO2_02_FULL_44_53]OGQ29286.1 MAG: hypothetical protein A3D98_05635 [Deltaproteobacteria bacterium RIFCSPHIGHO2_12_FULL_44_21]OGQ32843.1 MAG: hypothetical protein A2979_09780 [Deltaproteobacteria bacterium RIFCSPLOWO2_01_FULL_45_74]OGQ41944.1 MAG: hypothetical protein A3I70_09565 [Deltaproteobacteria bacterium 
MKRETKLWIEKADYDLETAEAMFQSSRYLYVAFACQQAVEKYLKAIIQEQTNILPPYIHNLPSLAKLTEINFEEKQIEFLILLTQYYLNTRYIDFKQKLLEGINKGKASDCLKKTKEIVTCLKKELKI